jgi:hypothetical protein
MIGDPSVSGTQYLIPFTKYRDPAGGNIVRTSDRRISPE